MVEKRKRQLIIDNVPSFVKSKSFASFIKEHGVEAECEKADNMTFCTLYFSDDEALDRGRMLLNGKKFKKRKIQVRADDADPVASLNDRVTPLWRLDYPQQLQSKVQKVEGVVHPLMDKYQPTLSVEVQIVESPSKYNYRNKCEFTFGFNHQHMPTLGFVMGSFKDGETRVESAGECLHVSIAAKKVVSVIQNYLNSETSLPVYDRVKKNGYWRLCLVRTSEYSKDIMLLVQVHPGTLTPLELAEEEQKFVSFIEASDAAVTTLFWQYRVQSSHVLEESDPVTLKFGPGTIRDTLTVTQTTFEFRVGPFSFFQSSTRGCELLYEKIANFLEYSNGLTVYTADHRVVLLDLCCGTGTIGITLSRLPCIKKIVGVDVCEQAIKDAEFNAKEHKVTNYQYICAPVEKCIQSVLEEAASETFSNENPNHDNSIPRSPQLPATQTLEVAFSDNADSTQPQEHQNKEISLHTTQSHDEIIAILDPPRCGVNKSVIKTLVKATTLNRIIYVSCDPVAALPNFKMYVLTGKRC